MQPSLKTLFGAAAVVMTVGAALAPSAHATCWWNGGDWNCTAPPPPGAVIAPGSGIAYAPYYIPAPSWGFDPRSYNSPGAPQQ